MTQGIGTTSKRRLSARFAGGVAISVLLALATFAAPASANWNGGNYHRNWNGGYYQAPPVVYGSAYGNGYYGSSYYAPPLVYGPSIGINLGGIGIGIR